MSQLRSGEDRDCPQPLSAPVGVQWDHWGKSGGRPGWSSVSCAGGASRLSLSPRSPLSGRARLGSVTESAAIRSGAHPFAFCPPDPVGWPHPASWQHLPASVPTRVTHPGPSTSPPLAWPSCVLRGHRCQDWG